jgi:DNA-binding PadR family transcriptional regulator
MHREKGSRFGGIIGRRLADPTMLILISLSSGPKHGYAMMEDIRQFSGIELEPGTLYGALTRLERQGLIAPCEAQDRRRPYRITGMGEEWLKERLQTLERIAETTRQRLARRMGWEACGC